MCINKKIPNGFHGIIGASIGGYVSRQIIVAFPNPHYESGAMRVAIDSDMVLK